MMRWLLGILVIANVAIFLWGQSIVRPGKLAHKDPMPEFGSIQLVRESAVESVTPEGGGQDRPQENSVQPPEEDSAEPRTASETAIESPSGLVPDEPGLAETEIADPLETVIEPEAEPASEPEPAKLPIEEPEIACGRIGPFKAEDAARTSLDKLMASGLSAELSETVEQVQNGYWVLIPALPSRAEGQDMVGRLREAGESDIWLINKGPLKNAISLGLYAGKKNAGRRSSQINKIGFASEVQPKMSEKTVFWLDYRGNSALLDGDELEKLSSGTTIEKKPCN